MYGSEYTKDADTPSTLTPFVYASTYTWSQLYTPVNLGTVYVIIDNLNHTKTVTSTNSSALTAASTQFLNNGTLQLLTRTDTNSDGTVTAPVPTGVGSTSIAAYPTPYFTVSDPIYWNGLAPVVQDRGVCCQQKVVTSAVPQNHYQFPQSTGSTNSRDLRGWLYVLTSNAVVYSGASNLSSLLAPATINSVLNFCSVHYPPGYDALCQSSSALGEVSAVNVAGELLTTTVHITDSASSTAPAASAVPAKITSSGSPQTSSSVQVNPATASVSPSTAPQTSVAAAQSSNSAGQSSNDNAAGQGQSSASQGQQSSASSGSSQSSKSGAQSQAGSSANPGPASSPATTVSVAPAPAPAPTSSSNNAGGIVASILGSHSTVTTQASNPSPGGVGGQSSSAASPVQSSNNPPVVISVGSSTAAIQTVQVTTSISGSATVVPAAVIGSQTVPIGSTVQVGSTPVVIATSGSQAFIVVGGTSSVLPAPAAASTAPFQPAAISTSIAGSATTVPGIVVGSQTVPLGTTVTISGTAFAVVTSESQIFAVVNGASTPLAQSITNSAPIVVAGSTVSANSASQYVVSGQTLVPGGSIMVGTGSSTTVIVLQTSGSQTLLVVGSATSTLPAAASQQTSLITVGPAVLTPLAASQYAVGSQTLTPGGSAITVSGTRYSLASGATELIYGSSTTKLPTSPFTTTPPPIIVGSSTITANSQSGYVIGSQTLSPGGSAITVSGTPYSLAPSATALIVGSSTEIATSQGNMGSYIWAGIGATANANSTGRSSSSSGIGSSPTTGVSSTAAPATSANAPSASQTSTKSAAPRVGTSFYMLAGIIAFTMILLM
ncbi:hypothetical protein LTR78_001077 [Recurvomyces mirabilis]|uniref:Uncharacterized protein n=1 Tax=Recurvomyces mirabilis TaxID=574656 RepID=A0AAE0WW95_9PEZI|nr:hypothetical protein LTR78_001077 [Recurvomyces mirabilis]KAK5159049.1 hypothetical protein LTS14_003157 [Recurvomyces mirabilis]